MNALRARVRARSGRKPRREASCAARATSWWSSRIKGVPSTLPPSRRARARGLAVPSLMAFADYREALPGPRPARQPGGDRQAPALRPISRRTLLGGEAPEVTLATAGPSTEPGDGAGLMTPDDAIAVARCTYAVYGYTLPDDYLYFPELMREMLGRRPARGVRRRGRTGGETRAILTCELERAGARVGYMEEGLVDPRFRHRGPARADVEVHAAPRGRARMLGLLRRGGHRAPRTRRRATSPSGSRRWACSSATRRPASSSSRSTAPRRRGARRRSLNYLKTTEAATADRVRPPHHRAVIDALSPRARFPETSATRPPARPAPRRTRPGAGRRVPGVERGVDPRHGLRPRLPDLVRARLRELCLQPGRLDRRGPPRCRTPGRRPLLCRPQNSGFFFAGVIPDLADDDDVLRLQYLNEVEADVESAQIASEFGKELFAYVVQAMDTTRA